MQQIFISGNPSLLNKLSYSYETKLNSLKDEQIILWIVNPARFKGLQSAKNFCMAVCPQIICLKLLCFAIMDSNFIPKTQKSCN